MSKYIVLFLISATAQAGQVCYWLAGNLVCKDDSPPTYPSQPVYRPQTCTWIMVAGQWKQVCE